jgi:exosortase
MSESFNNAEHSSRWEAPQHVALWGSAMAVLLLAALYWPTGIRLVQAWQTDPNYMHGFFVLPISLLFAWSYLRSHPAPDHGDAFLGWQGILAGGVLHLVALLFEWNLVDFVALFFLLRGLAIMAGGREWARGLLFPILFLFFMFPLPFFLTNLASLWLQQIVTTTSGFLLNLAVGCTTTGNELLLAGTTRLKVGQECSGMRQIVAFLALGTVMAWWSRRGSRTKTLLVALAVPIAVLTNIVRVLEMAFGALWFNIDWSNAEVHDIPAMVTMPLGLLLYLAVLRVVDPPASVAPATKEAA